MATDQNGELLMNDEGSAALDENEQKSSALGFLSNTDVLRQITLILGLAICLAIAVFILLWGKEPDMRPLGTAMIGTRSEFKQQVDAVRRQSRFVEFQISKLEQEKQPRLDELKADLYKLRRSFPKSEELAALQQKIDRLTELYDEKISAERGNLMALKSKVVSLERQYAQNN